ncbi:unnamed protein product [Spirodela intermedia]|uniref:Uncharacterized protein n=1 Tax=Spirodela intermedia TaxID=51605 RepID=A0A7I8IWX5_SPIIN|nr:unnamed protein product [Spirodela intermedia]CAA6662095.1 unnamed protein product [Spirodela intermedia]
MLRDRGYAVSAVEIEQSLSQFRSVHGQQPDLERIRISVLTIFCGSGPFKLANLRGIIDRIKNEIFLRMILVLEGKLTHQARQATKELPFTVEIFQINELLVNVTKHVLMQAHEILTEEDKQKLLNKYGLKENQLPRMLASDAIARYYGLEPGQVVKVTHDGEDTGFHATYRCVV